MGSGPGGIKVEVLTNQKGDVVYWAPRFTPKTLKNTNINSSVRIAFKCCSP